MGWILVRWKRVTNNTKILSPCLQLAVILLLKMELAEEARLPANFVDTSAGRTCMARGMFEGLYQDEWRPTTPHLWTPWRHPPKHVHCARQWSWESKSPASVYHLARHKAPRERADAHKKELKRLKHTVNLKTRDSRGRGQGKSQFATRLLVLHNYDPPVYVNSPHSRNYDQTERNKRGRTENNCNAGGLRTSKKQNVESIFSKATQCIVSYVWPVWVTTDAIKPHSWYFQPQAPRCKLAKVSR